MIHVYHERAAELAGRIRDLARGRSVVALASRDELRAAIRELEVVLAPEPPRDGWAGAERLRLIQLLGAGADQLLPSPDLPECVEVAGVRGVFAADVAEHVLAMMLVHARRIPALLVDQERRRFEPTPRPTLAGERLTIVGLGEVGRRLARIATVIGMRVRGVSRTGRPIEGINVVASDRVAEAIGDARFVVLAVPLTAHTRGMFDRAMLARLRRDAVVVNVARGGILDERALTDALTSGRIAGAAVDVFEHEPLPPDHFLWTASNLIITPHIAGLGEHYVDRCFEVLLDNVRRLDAGLPRCGVVDRKLGY